MNDNHVLQQALFRATLRRSPCKACGQIIDAGKDRVLVRPTWNDGFDTLCKYCWQTIMTWAAIGAVQEVLPMD